MQVVKQSEESLAAEHIGQLASRSTKPSAVNCNLLSEGRQLSGAGTQHNIGHPCCSPMVMLIHLYCGIWSVDDVAQTKQGQPLLRLCFLMTTMAGSRGKPSGAKRLRACEGSSAMCRRWPPSSRAGCMRQSWTHATRQPWQMQPWRRSSCCCWTSQASGLTFKQARWASK